MDKLPIAIQLFSVIPDMEKDPIGTLKKLKKIGYDGVELLGLQDLNPYYYKGILDTVGLTPISAHISYGELSPANYDRTVETYKILGCKYIVIAYLGQNELPGGAGFGEFIMKLRESAEKLKEDGLTLVYHNHAHEFDRVNGDYIFDTLMNCVPADLLSAEIDVGWVNKRNIDPVSFVRSYKGRLPLIHLKDYASFDEKEGIIETCPFGDGLVNGEAVVKAAADSGTEWLVVEQDRPYKRKSAIKCAEISIKNIRKFNS